MVFKKGHTLSRKTYISYELQERECINCGKIMPLSKFGLEPSGIPRASCKKCKTQNELTRYRTRRMRDFPEKYYECLNDDCSYIWIKNKEFCPKCGSKGE